MSDSGMVEKSSLPSERERFELWAHMGPCLPLDMVVSGERYASYETQHAWQAWQFASAGRQELLEALKKARNQLDQDCFTDENAAACLERIYALLAKHGA